MHRAAFWMPNAVFSMQSAPPATALEPLLHGIKYFKGNLQVSHQSRCNVVRDHDALQQFAASCIEIAAICIKTVAFCFEIATISIKAIAMYVDIATICIKIKAFRIEIVGAVVRGLGLWSEGWDCGPRARTVALLLGPWL